MAHTRAHKLQLVLDAGSPLGSAGGNITELEFGGSFQPARGRDRAECHKIAMWSPPKEVGQSARDLGVSTLPVVPSCAHGRSIVRFGSGGARPHSGGARVSFTVRGSGDSGNGDALHLARSPSALASYRGSDLAASFPKPWLASPALLPLDVLLFCAELAPVTVSRQLATLGYSHSLSLPVAPGAIARAAKYAANSLAEAAASGAAAAAMAASEAKQPSPLLAVSSSSSTLEAAAEALATAAVSSSVVKSFNSKNMATGPVAIENVLPMQLQRAASTPSSQLALSLECNMASSPRGISRAVKGAYFDDAMAVSTQEAKSSAAANVLVGYVGAEISDTNEVVEDALRVTLRSSRALHFLSSDAMASSFHGGERLLSFNGRRSLSNLPAASRRAGSAPNFPSEKKDMKSRTDVATEAATAPSSDISAITKADTDMQLFNTIGARVCSAASQSLVETAEPVETQKVVPWPSAEAGTNFNEISAMELRKHVEVGTVIIETIPSPPTPPLQEPLMWPIPPLPPPLLTPEKDSLTPVNLAFISAASSNDSAQRGSIVKGDDTNLPVPQFAITLSSPRPHPSIPQYREIGDESSRGFSPLPNCKPAMPRINLRARGSTRMPLYDVRDAATVTAHELQLPCDATATSATKINFAESAATADVFVTTSAFAMACNAPMHSSLHAVTQQQPPDVLSLRFAAQRALLQANQLLHDSANRDAQRATPHSSALQLPCDEVLSQPLSTQSSVGTAKLPPSAKIYAHSHQPASANINRRHATWKNCHRRRCRSCRSRPRKHCQNRHGVSCNLERRISHGKKHCRELQCHRQRHGCCRTYHSATPSGSNNSSSSSRGGGGGGGKNDGTSDAGRGRSASLQRVRHSMHRSSAPHTSSKIFQQPPTHSLPSHPLSSPPSFSTQLPPVLPLQPHTPSLAPKLRSPPQMTLSEASPMQLLQQQHHLFPLPFQVLTQTLSLTGDWQVYPHTLGHASVLATVPAVIVACQNGCLSNASAHAATGCSTHGSSAMRASTAAVAAAVLHPLHLQQAPSVCASSQPQLQPSILTRSSSPLPPSPCLMRLSAQKLLLQSPQHQKPTPTKSSIVSAPRIPQLRQLQPSFEGSTSGCVDPASCTAAVLSGKNGTPPSVGRVALTNNIKQVMTALGMTPPPQPLAVQQSAVSLTAEADTRSRTPAAISSTHHPTLDESVSAADGLLQTMRSQQEYDHSAGAHGSTTNTAASLYMSYELSQASTASKQCDRGSDIARNCPSSSVLSARVGFDGISSMHSSNDDNRSTIASSESPSSTLPPTAMNIDDPVIGVVLPSLAERRMHTQRCISETRSWEGPTIASTLLCLSRHACGDGVMQSPLLTLAHTAGESIGGGQTKCAAEAVEPEDAASALYSLLRHMSKPQRLLEKPAQRYNSKERFAFTAAASAILARRRATVSAHAPIPTAASAARAVSAICSAIADAAKRGRIRAPAQSMPPYALTMLRSVPSTLTPVAHRWILEATAALKFEPFYAVARTEARPDRSTGSGYRAVKQGAIAPQCVHTDAFPTEMIDTWPQISSSGVIDPFAVSRLPPVDWPAVVKRAVEVPSSQHPTKRTYAWVLGRDIPPPALSTLRGAGSSAASESCGACSGVSGGCILGKRRLSSNVSLALSVSQPAVTAGATTTVAPPDSFQPASISRAHSCTKSNVATRRGRSAIQCQQTHRWQSLAEVTSSGHYPSVQSSLTKEATAKRRRLPSSMRGEIDKAAPTPPFACVAGLACPPAPLVRPGRDLGLYARPKLSQPISTQQKKSRRR